jgi:hypothetical protein
MQPDRPAPGALGRESNRGRTPDTGSCAGDHDDFVVEASAHHYQHFSAVELGHWRVWPFRWPWPSCAALEQGEVLGVAVEASPGLQGAGVCGAWS